MFCIKYGSESNLLRINHLFLVFWCKVNPKLEIWMNHVMIYRSGIGIPPYLPKLIQIRDLKRFKLIDIITISCGKRFFYFLTKLYWQPMESPETLTSVYIYMYSRKINKWCSCCTTEWKLFDYWKFKFSWTKIHWTAYTWSQFGIQYENVVDTFRQVKNPKQIFSCILYIIKGHSVGPSEGDWTDYRILEKIYEKNMLWSHPEQINIAFIIQPKQTKQKQLLLKVKHRRV